MNHKEYFTENHLKSIFGENWNKIKYNYLLEMNETEEEAIQRLNLYCKVPFYKNIFDFFDDIVIKIINGEKIPVNVINLCGGRFGMKTHEITKTLMIKLIIASFKYNKKIAIYGFRKIGGKALEDLKKEIETRINEFNLIQSDNKKRFEKGSHYIYTSRYNTPLFNFRNGSFITLQGLYKANDDRVALKGLASAAGYDISIAFREEANEIKDHEFQAINFAIRGAKQYLEINASNPDNEFQDYIKYCKKNVPFIKEELENKGFQFKILKNIKTGFKEIFCYTNFMANPYVRINEIQNFLKMKEEDPIKWEAWGLGIPGSNEKSVFARYLINMKPKINFNPVEFTAGLDLGHADSPDGHPTVLEIIGKDIYGNIEPIEEYYHSNNELNYKNTQHMQLDILETLIRLGDKYPLIKKQHLYIKVDYGGGGKPFTDSINELKNRLYYGTADWFSFKEVDKNIYFIKDRVDITIALLVLKILTINKELTPYLIEKMNLMIYQINKNLNSKHNINIVDLEDDPWDALFYGLMEWIPELIERINRKNPIYLKGLTNYANI